MHTTSSFLADFYARDGVRTHVRWPALVSGNPVFLIASESHCQTLSLTGPFVLLCEEKKSVVAAAPTLAVPACPLSHSPTASFGLRGTCKVQIIKHL